MRMEGICKFVQQVWCAIKYRVQIFVSEVTKVRRLMGDDLQVLTRLGVKSMESRQLNALNVRWMKPTFGRWKLNLDGSSYGNPGAGGGGGVLRDHDGRSVFAFSTVFGSCTNNEVELQTIVEGIKICCQCGYSCIDIECDSLIVVSWLMNKTCTVWYLWDFWDHQLTFFDGIDFSIKHIFREGNKVADELARVGSLGKEILILESVDLPYVVRGLYRLELMGTSYVRHRI